MDNRIVHQLGMRDGLAIALAKYRHQGTDAFQELEATVAKKESFIHHLGELDAYSFILMLVQEHGAKEGLKKVAEKLLENEPDHPHAKWIMEQK